MSQKNRFANDNPDADLKKLFQAATPDAPPMDVERLFGLHRQSDNRMTDAVPASVAASRTGNWNRVLVSIAGLAAIAALFLLIWRGLPENTSFADVQAQVNRLKTVQFTNFKTTPGDFSTEPRKLRVKILSRHLQITEAIGHPGFYDLLDSRAGRFITVDTKNKIYREIKTKVNIDQRTGERSVSPMEIPRHVDFYENITSFPEDTFEFVGSGSVGSRPAELFQRVYVQGLTTRTVSIWVDPRTRLPLHVEIRLRSNVPDFEEINYTYTDFVYDEPLDPALFDTHPPEGYSLIDGEFIERN